MGFLLLPSLGAILFVSSAGLRAQHPLSYALSHSHARQPPERRPALAVGAIASSSSLTTAFNAPLTPIPMVEICANGQVTRYSATLTSIRSTQASYRLSSRDVRLLRSSTPALQVRQGYIIFDFGDLKGVLQHDRITLINTDRPAARALANEVQKRLTTDRNAEEAPFEVRALETMLEQVYLVIEETLSRLDLLVTSTLDELTNSPSQSEGRRETALGRLLPLRISLNSLQARTRRLNTLLEELLDNDEDIADMCLTLVQKTNPDNPQIFSRSQFADIVGGDEEVLHQAAEEEAEEAEAAQELISTLLDVYDARFEALGDSIDQLASNIETTQEVLELTLDNERNRIARLELLLSMAGICVGTCSAVSGFFGMNLISGLEEARGVFLIVVGTSMLLTGSFFFSCFRWFRSLAFTQRGRLQDVQALKNVLNNLDAVTLLLRDNPGIATSPAKRMQEELSKMLCDLGFPSMSDRELRLLCSLIRQQRVNETRERHGLSVLAAI